jgi:hypothetical protein
MTAFFEKVLMYAQRNHPRGGVKPTWDQNGPGPLRRFPAMALSPVRNTLYTAVTAT